MNTNVYDNLYTNMKNTFTVVKNDQEYTLGEFMLMKAGKKKTESVTLPSGKNENQGIIVSLFNYVNEKLEVKNPPAKDKTMRAFPFRTAITAAFSALVVSSLLLAYGSAALMSDDPSASSVVEVTDTLESEEVDFEVIK